MGNGNVTKAAMLAESGLVEQPRQRNKRGNINTHVYISKKGSTGSGANASPQQEDPSFANGCVFEVANISHGLAVSLISSAFAPSGCGLEHFRVHLCLADPNINPRPECWRHSTPKAYERVHQLGRDLEL